MNQPIRFLDIDQSQAQQHATALEAIYNDELDAVVIRGVLSPSIFKTLQNTLSGQDLESAWDQPNEGFPGLGIRVLGLAATVCGTMPNGPDKDEYFLSAAHRRDQLDQLFGAENNPMNGIEDVIADLADERPVALARNPDNREFGPCTVRSLPHGEGILLHHDTHYRIPVYEDLLPQLDTSSCISFFTLMQRPEQGGSLDLYHLYRDQEGDLPRLPNGILDPVAVDQQIEKTRFDMQEGDMIIFSAGKIYHRVEPVQGARTRVTLGGFMALDKAHEKVHYWS